MRAAALLLPALLAAGCMGPIDVPGPALATFPAMVVETRLGSFTAVVFAEDAPETAAFMRKLVEGKYYDGRQFGRVIPGFVIQEVDRTGGTTDQKETVTLEAGTRVMFSAGAFGIARDADPESGGSEFFVMDHAVSTLYGNYTAFAQVVEGMDVVHAIARVPAVKTGPAGVVSAPPGSPLYFGVHDRVPVDPVVMTRVTWTDVTLTQEEAARYPLRVGETTRADALRATLEWPADLKAGKASALTWWVAPRDASPQGQVRDPEPVPLGAVVVEARGGEAQQLAPEVDEALGRVAFAWTPPAPGEYALRLLSDGTEIAGALVTVL